MPKTAMARIDKIDINVTDISDQMAEVQTQIEETEAPAQPDLTPMAEANAGSKGTCYRLQIWNIPKDSNRRKTTMEEITNLARHAERHP